MHMRIFTLIAVSVAILLSAAPGIRAGQSPAASQEATGSITGRVTIENEGAPGVTVTLRGAPSRWPLPPPVARATTDKEGRFQMSNLPEGQYYLVPLTPAYFTPSEDRMITSGKPVTLTKGETLEEIELKLIRCGVITGRVTTAGGQPVIGRRIYIRAADQQQLLSTIEGALMFETDDHGVYRIYGLPAGRFVIGVENKSPTSPSSWVFHPGVTEESQAGQVDVVAGRVVENIDIKLPPITGSYEASGRVIDEATGQPIPQISVIRSALKAADNSAFAYTLPQPVDEHGAFRFSNLTPGRYAVYISIGGEYYSDEVIFDVKNQDVTGLEIKARHGASLSGVVIIEGSRDPSVLSALSNLRVGVNRWTSVHAAGSAVGADGRFRITGLPPGKFRLGLGSAQQQRFTLLGAEREGVPLPEWFEVSAGEQVTGLRLIAAHAMGVVRGQVQVVGGKLPAGASLGVSARRADFPGHPDSGPHARVDAHGRFMIEGLTTGVHEISLTAYAPSQSGGGGLSPLLTSVRQTVSVTSGTESEVTLTLDLNAVKVKEEK
jgi:hypothetical protein